MLFRFFFKKIKIRRSRKGTGGPFLRFLREALLTAEEYRATPFSVRLVGLLDYLDLDLKKTEAKKANTIEAAAGCGGQSAFQNAQQSLIPNCFPYTFG